MLFPYVCTGIAKIALDSPTLCQTGKHGIKCFKPSWQVLTPPGKRGQKSGSTPSWQAFKKGLPKERYCRGFNFGNFSVSLRQYLSWVFADLFSICACASFFLQISNPSEMQICLKQRMLWMPTFQFGSRLHYLGGFPANLKEKLASQIPGVLRLVRWSVGRRSPACLEEAKAPPWLFNSGGIRSIACLWQIYQFFTVGLGLVGR